MDYIFIKHDLYEYKIPLPHELCANMENPHQMFVVTREIANTSNTFEKDSHTFFTENPVIFKEYFAYMVETNNIPENFYMYVDSIIQFIRFKYTKDKSDDYWKHMVEYQETKEQRVTPRPAYRAW